jgi:murein DD-endopeptidase MepM/ murein hydrolase activator NlpD
MEILMRSIKAVGLLLLVNNVAWAQLTPEQEEARNQGLFFLNMIKSKKGSPFLEISAMTTATYSVQQGDTLGQIAQRFGIGIADLQRLNPCIKNPSYVRAGWVLKVPDSVVAPAPDNAEPTPELLTPDVLQLNPIAAPPEHCTIDFCGEQRCHSPTHFADLIYEAGQNRFWLLREHTLNRLVAADNLKRNLLTTDPDSRINALSNAGLLEPFLEPKASSFLDGSQSQRYLEIECLLTDIRNEIDQIQAQAKARNDVNSAKPPQVTWEESLLIGERQRDYHTLQRELAALDAQGQKVARDRGYRFENGHLYSAEALKARAIIQRYLKQRQKLLDLGAPHYSEEDIKEFTREQDELLAGADPAIQGFVRSERDIAEWVRHSTGKFHYSELVKTLLEAAAYGLALPEYALKGDDEDIQEGFKKYEKYHSWLRDKAKLDKGVDDSFNHWVNVTHPN